MSCIDRIAKARRFLFFLLAGGVNTLFGYALFGLLLWVGMMPSPAAILATLGGMLFNFGSLGTVFGSCERRRLPRFAAVYAAQLILNLLLLRGFISGGMPAMVAQACVITLLAPCSFVAMRRFVFAPSSLMET